MTTTAENTVAIDHQPLLSSSDSSTDPRSALRLSVPVAFVLTNTERTAATSYQRLLINFLIKWVPVP